MPNLIIITGMSGAGKSTALRCFEDLGYCCVDNLPPELIETFVQLYREQRDRHGDIAVVCDVRSGELFENFHDAIDSLTERGLELSIVFLDCKDSVLISRFKEARRRPPLGMELRLEEAISLERQRLDPLTYIATHVFDTSALSPPELREQLLNTYITESDGKPIVVTVMSFGFKYGAPMDADFIFDARFLKNPYYVEELRNLTGNDAAVQEYILEDAAARPFVDAVQAVLDIAVPRYRDVHKASTTIAIGCTGGKHRSVFSANHIAAKMKRLGLAVTVQHRDVERL